MSPRVPNVALYGAGMISRAHGAAAQLAGFTVSAVASRNPERADERATEFGARCTTYDELRSGAVRADVVVVATPPHCHADDAIALLTTGAVVLLEKPLCRTLEEADRLVDAAALHPRRLVYGENLVVAPPVRALLAQVATMGALRHLELRTLQGRPTWGAFTSDEWGGGAVFDLGVHPLAVALLCAAAAGAGDPVEVQCTLRGGTDHGSDEWGEVRVRFRHGLQARIEVSWQHGPAPMWDVQAASDTAAVRLDLLPEVSLERNGEPVALARPTSPLPALHDLGYLAQLRAAAHRGDADVLPVAEASFGRLVLDVVCAAYASAGHGGIPVSLPFTGPRNRTPLELWRRQ